MSVSGLEWKEIFDVCEELQAALHSMSKLLWRSNLHGIPAPSLKDTDVTRCRFPTICSRL